MSHFLSAPPTAGFIYVKLPDPYNGSKVITEAARSDSKMIKTENIWLSKSRNGQGWDCYLNLFDVSTTGSYTVKFDDSATLPQAPVIEHIPDKTGIEGHQIAFIIQASDPDGTTPTLSAEPLPVGATFTDQQDGTGAFDWTPAEGQAGAYAITFSASDGVLQASRQAVITVNSQIRGHHTYLIKKPGRKKNKYVWCPPISHTHERRN